MLKRQDALLKRQKRLRLLKIVNYPREHRFHHFITCRMGKLKLREIIQIMTSQIQLKKMRLKLRCLPVSNLKTIILIMSQNRPQSSMRYSHQSNKRQLRLTFRLKDPLIRIAKTPMIS